MMKPSTLVGVVLGGAATYYGDPRSGAARRRILRAKLQELRSRRSELDDEAQSDLVAVTATVWQMPPGEDAHASR